MCWGKEGVQGTLGFIPHPFLDLGTLPCRKEPFTQRHVGSELFPALGCSMTVS